MHTICSHEHFFVSCWPSVYSVFLITTTRLTDFSQDIVRLGRSIGFITFISLCNIIMSVRWDDNKYNKPLLTVMLTLTCISEQIIECVIPQSSAVYIFIYGVWMTMRVTTLATVIIILAKMLICCALCLHIAGVVGQQ